MEDSDKIKCTTISNHQRTHLTLKTSHLTLKRNFFHKGGEPGHFIAKSIDYRLMQCFAHLLVPLLQVFERGGLKLHGKARPSLVMPHQSHQSRVAHEPVARGLRQVALIHPVDKLAAHSAIDMICSVADNHQCKITQNSAIMQMTSKQADKLTSKQATS